MTRFVNVEEWPCSDADYFFGEAVGSSNICRALGFEGPSGPVGDIGKATHRAILEPDRFDSTVLCPPPECRVGSGKGQKSRLDAWLKQNGGAMVLNQSEYDLAKSMRDALLNHPVANMQLRRDGTVIERSYKATDSVTGLTVRIRPDAWRPAICWDVKTAKTATFHGFSQSVSKNGYFIQAALYTDVLTALTGRVPRFAWLVAGKMPPHWAGVYEATDEWLDYGRRFYSAGLDIIAAARESEKPVRPWWSVGGHQLEPPPKYLEDSALLHEQYARQVKGES